MNGHDDIAWSGTGWSISITNGVTIQSDKGPIVVPIHDVYLLTLRRRWFKWELHWDNSPVATLSGISRTDTRLIKQALHAMILDHTIAGALSWTHQVDSVIDSAISTKRWITTETKTRLSQTRPAPLSPSQVASLNVIGTLNAHQTRALEMLNSDVDVLITRTNQWILETELSDQRAFFDSIEKSPLTTEQATAVACFDNRVQVLASAGSGKTSVMVARAAYAIKRGFVAPEQVLLLAFNKAAADELAERVAQRFDLAGIDPTGIRTATFHSFGLDVIGAATAKKPRLAPWLDDNNGVPEILRIVDALRDSSIAFRTDWDLYRLLFASTPTSLDDDSPDAWDSGSATAGYRTFAGEVVKSHGEQMVADFLYLNGVNYRYEDQYPVDLADSSHSQYRPDFYYPDADVWHEHWALDRDGNPPSEFAGYGESIIWKRSIHRTHRTTLIESTWAEVVFGDGLAKLQSQLESHGVRFDWNPDRPLNQWTQPLEHESLAQLVRTFMAHIKSNSLTRQLLEKRLTGSPDLHGFRTQLFLRIYWQIHDEWQQRLVATNCVDFEDMLIAAACHLESGSIDMGFNLVMVDEFQDASQARARLTRALVSQPNRFLLAVGDDWQAINRFAGADLSVMTNFEDWFGPSTQLALTTTFRCPQSLSDIAREFVSRNPSQFAKAMSSARPETGEPVRVVLDEDDSRAVSSYLSQLSTKVANGSIAPGPNGKVSVNILGRYRFQRDCLSKAPDNLDVQFRTVHSSKGLEADYIIIVGMGTGTYGFPSSIADDPVLSLSMPIGEQFPHAEERRLFYVALTRAKREVTIVTPPQRMSPFVIEILNHPNVSVESLGSKQGSGAPKVTVCTECRTGTMVRRTGRYGPFLGCTNFPACRNTMKS